MSHQDEQVHIKQVITEDDKNRAFTGFSIEDARSAFENLTGNWWKDAERSYSDLILKKTILKSLPKFQSKNLNLAITVV